jgi:hypothetical protein
MRLGFQKIAIICRKMVKIAKNIDRNIDHIQREAKVAEKFGSSVVDFDSQMLLFVTQN